MLTNEQKRNIDDMDYEGQLVAACRTKDLDVMEYLSNSTSWRIRYWVSTNGHISINLLTKLSKDKVWDVRYGVAYNDCTPRHILMKLANDKHVSVRCAVEYLIKEMTYESKCINIDRHTIKGILE